ncbi:hypothetical protein T11_3902 [Trichinella zimbabwensis]|uniref:Uncharacterized protein n=1 Tax=Trichinella zimbabwensis TaxID=268475 RepID=A0A0V1HIP2_9BILA|nr:hypothetical protein T11_15727 [Trichinella zimbabwensis]KRZ15674.1 hypothetical protein T11_3902 [Trichinella zimbabwensis]
MVRNKSASAKETESSVEFYCEKNGSVIIKRLVYYTDQQNITLDTRRRVLIKSIFLLWRFLSDIGRGPWMEALRFD